MGFKTWGDTSSVTVLVPFVVGLVGFVVFIAYEATLETHLPPQ